MAHSSVRSSLLLGLLGGGAGLILGYAGVERLWRFLPSSSNFIQPKMDPNAAKPANGQIPDLSAMASAFEKDLGKITMQTDVQQLSGVVVTATSTRLKASAPRRDSAGRSSL